MSIHCPSCGSTQIIARYLGLKVAATAGGIAGTASGVAGASEGAKTGLTLGIAAGPLRMALGSLSGAILGGLIGCVTGEVGLVQKSVTASMSAFWTTVNVLIVVAPSVSNSSKTSL